jgi:glycerol-3-phosphate responsive antiterminator
MTDDLQMLPAVGPRIVADLLRRVRGGVVSGGGMLSSP